MTWKFVGDIAFYAATGAAVLFSLLYGFLAPWWKTVAGRNVMWVMGSVALAFLYFTWAIAIGGIPPGFDVSRALIFGFIACAIGARTMIFIRHHVIRSLRGGEGESHHELEDPRQVTRHADRDDRHGGVGLLP